MTGNLTILRMDFFMKLFLTLIIYFFISKAFAQKTNLKSPFDDLLTIKSISIAPFEDNVSSIYAKPLTSQIKNIIDEDRQWSLTTYPETQKNTPEELEDHPEKVQNLLQKIQADALITGRIIKGPQGISIKINLFLAADGKVISQVQNQNIQLFEISDLRNEIKKMYLDLKAKLPYTGKILSRRGNSVTIDIGSIQGLKEDSDLNVVQVIKITRHPKYNFIVSVEKEIIGKLKIQKIEKSLSFAQVTMEQFENVIQPNMKTEIVKYIEHPESTESPSSPELNHRKDRVFLGDSPQEWAPNQTPSIGKVALMFGLGQYSVSNTLETSGAVNGSQFPAPNLGLESEIWMTSDWFLHFDLQQHIVTINNSLANSGPGKLNFTSSQLGMFVGYNFLLEENFFGPKLQVLGGFSQLNSQVDTSTPTAYTSVKFNGMGVGFGGSFPMNIDVPLSVGAQFIYFISSDLSESPVSSGNSYSTKISQFKVFGDYRWNSRMNFKSELRYDLYSANIAGGATRSEAASSLSHSLTNLLFGVEYLF